MSLSHNKSLSLVASDSRNFKVDSLSLDIISVGGHYTCIQLPKYKIAIDMGICPKNAIRANKVFFTHPHPDHMSAMIQHLSTKEMLKMSQTSYFLEEEHKENFENMLQAWRKLGFCSLQCNVVGVIPEETYSLSNSMVVQPFRSVHRVPCIGYTFMTKRKKLLPEFQELSEKEIIEARKSNASIFQEIQEQLLSVTGDTTHHVFRNNPQIFKSNVLITEVTFFDDKVSTERAQKLGHMHIQDLIHYEEQLAEHNTKLVIMHLSSRYSIGKVADIVYNTFSKEVRENITIIPNEMII